MNIADALSFLRAIIAIVAMPVGYGGNHAVGQVALGATAALDFADGAVARKLKIVCWKGARADLLSDLLCFALLPCALCLNLESTAYAWIGGLLLLGYALVRINYRSWRARGFPLPVVGIIFGITCSSNLFFPWLLIAVPMVGVCSLPVKQNAVEAWRRRLTAVLCRACRISCQPPLSQTSNDDVTSAKEQGDTTQQIAYIAYA